MCERVTPPTVLYPELYTKTDNSCQDLVIQTSLNDLNEFGAPEPEIIKKKGGKKQFVNTYNRNKQYFKDLLDRNITPSCTIGYIKGGCESGHRFLKAVYCNKEWCGNCGMEASPIHRRRIHRWHPKVFTFNSMGYFVITIPACLRDRYNDKLALHAFRTYCKRKLQRMGFERGLIRWHAFGQCERCSGDGCDTCNNTGAGTTYKPHMNIFIESGFLSKSILDALRNDLTRYFRNNHRDIEPERLKGQAHFQYTIESAQMAHQLKYVTRATFRILDDRTRRYEATWKGFRVSSTWGKFPKPETESTNDLCALENGNCPHCLQVEQVSKLSWDVGHYVNKVNQETGEVTQVFKRTFVTRRDIHENGTKLTHIDAGYYAIDD